MQLLAASPLYRPVGQGRQNASPPLEYVPALHGVGMDDALMHSCPAGQVTQYAQFDREYVPFGQSCGVSAVVEQKDPAGHVVHSVWFASA